MANAYVVPFDFNPVDTHEFGALSFSYTVPAGKYAIVTYTLTVSASWRGRGTTGSGSTPGISNGNNSAAGEIVLKAGDVLTRSVSAPSGTSTADDNVTIATAEIRVNGNAVGYVSTRATFGQVAAASQTYTISNDSIVHASIREYNIAT
jgi:hypothetical protein